LIAKLVWVSLVHRLGREQKILHPYIPNHKTHSRKKAQYKTRPKKTPFTLSGDKSELNKTPKHRPPYYPNMYSNNVTATTDRSVDGETEEREAGRK
jgi:hypothetical protein